MLDEIGHERVRLRWSEKGSETSERLLQKCRQIAFSARIRALAGLFEAGVCAQSRMDIQSRLKEGHNSYRRMRGRVLQHSREGFVLRRP